MRDDRIHGFFDWEEATEQGFLFIVANFFTNRNSCYYWQNPLFNGLDIQKYLWMKYRIATVNVGILQGGNFENGRITKKHKLYLPGT